MGSACPARSRHNLHCSSSETWLDVAELLWHPEDLNLRSGLHPGQPRPAGEPSEPPKPTTSPVHQFLCHEAPNLVEEEAKVPRDSDGEGASEGHQPLILPQKQRPGQGEVTGARRRPWEWGRGGGGGGVAAAGMGVGGEWN
ncbi:hypothetical protein GH733_010734, partial [Mirounga leonina]